MNAMRLVVIGNGMVGQRLLERLAAGHHGFSITVLAEEPRPAYDRVGLTSFFSARSPGDLSLVPEGFFEANGITLHLSERAVSIDREARTVMSSTGRVIGYDRLVLATGSIPFVPPIPGRERPQCFVYRTIEDLLAIREAARHARSGAVIGGGLLGLEAAKALLDLGLETHVVEFAPRLMAVQVDEGGGARASPPHRGAGRARAHRQVHHCHRCGYAAAACAALRRRRIGGGRPGGLLGRHPPAGCAGAGVRAGGRASRGHRDRRCLPHQ